MKSRSGQSSRTPASLSNDSDHKTKRKKAEENLRKEVERGSLLLELYEKAPQLSNKQLYDYALEHVVKLTDSSIGFFHLVSDDQKNVILTAWNTEALKKCTVVYDTHYPIDRAGNWVDCVRLKRPVIYNDYAKSPNQKGLPEGHAPVRRFLSIPVIEGGKIRIIFGVGNKHKKYDDHDVVHIQLIANELQKIITQRQTEEAFRKSEKDLREAQRIGLLGSWDWDVLTNSITWSEEYYRIYGFDPKEQPPGYEEHLKAYTPESAARLDAAVKKSMETGEPYELDLKHVRSDGMHRWVCARCEIKRNANGQIAGLRGTAQDITERKQAEIEIARINRALQMLSASNQALIHITDEARLLNEVCRIAVDVGGYRMAWVGLAEHDEEKTLRPVANAGFDSGYIESARVSWADNERGRGPGGLAIRTGEPYIVRNIPLDPVFAPWREAALQRSYKSLIALPLMSESQTLGALGIYSEETDAFDIKEVEILKELASDLAFGITTLRTRTKRDQAEETLKEQYSTLHSIINSTNALVFSVDRQYRYTSFNKGHAAIMRAIYGVEIEINHCLLDYMTVTEDREKARRNIDRALAGEHYSEAAYSGEKKLSRLFFEVSHNPVFVEDGTVIGVAVFAQDITDRKRIEEALRVSEEQYRLIAENTADTITVLDINLKITYASPSALKLRGYTAEETMAQSLDQIFTPASLQKIRKVFADQMTLEATGKADPSRTESLELEEYHRNGSTIWVEIALSFLRDITLKPIGIISVTRDITKRKRAEVALRESQALYHSFIEQLPNAVFRKDSEGRYVMVNSQFCRIKGVKAEDFLGRKPVEVASSEFAKQNERGHTSKYAAQGEEVHELIMRTGKAVETEEEYPSTDGEKQFMHVIRMPVFDPDGKVVGTQGILFDITEHKRAEVELRRLTHAIEQSPVSVIMTNTAGDIEYVNPKFTEITGYTKDEVLGKNPRILKSGEISSEEYRNLWESLLAGKEWRGEFHNKKKNGDLFWEEASISPVRDEKGIITHFIAIKEDITERKRSEEELKQNEMRRHELERELIQSQKLESLGTLASGIAHDFNNILAIILGYSTLLEHALSDPKKASLSLDAIQRAALRGASLVKQLLTFARKGESLFTSVSITSIINEVINLLQATLPKTIDLVTELKPGIPSIHADATQIHQVLLNLCVNARDAMPQGGKLIITTSTIGNKAIVLRFPRATAREYLFLKVTDTGTGMDEETKQKIFDPFFTTKGPGRGTGLGLALVHSIVESHHGMMVVESILGKGTTFSLYFPIEELSVKSDVFSTDSLVDVPGGTETILLVEDEEMLAEMVKMVLVAKGYTVLTACDGEEGLEMFQRHQKQIAVVLTDLGLPKYGGDEVFKRIKAIDKNAKVILASGFVEAATKSEMLEAGLEQFIQKPYSPSDVLHAIRTVIERVR